MEPESTETGVTFEEIRAEHWPAVRSILGQGISTGNATFETKPPSWKDWNRSHRPDCRILIREKGEVVGWAALSPVSGRCVYGGVAEVSVYVAEGSRGRGLGRLLLAELIRQSEEAGLWTLQAGIFPENLPSLKIHESLGFRVVGVRERIGQHLGRWRDVLLLERRSERVGRT